MESTGKPQRGVGGKGVRQNRQAMGSAIRPILENLEDRILLFKPYTHVMAGMDALKEKVAAAGIAASTASGAIAGGGATEGEVVAALQALGYSLAEARDASHAALVDATIGGTLEDRVKAALRSLLRD